MSGTSRAEMCLLFPVLDPPEASRLKMRRSPLAPRRSRPKTHTCSKEAGETERERNYFFRPTFAGCTQYESGSLFLGTSLSSEVRKILL